MLVFASCSRIYEIKRGTFQPYFLKIDFFSFR